MTVKHEIGYRSSLAYPKALVLLKSHSDSKFLDHFNNYVKTLANLYNIDVITQDEFEK